MKLLGIKSLVLSCTLVLLSIPLFSQQTKGLKPLSDQANEKQGVTRAVIVGISDYQNKNITDLQYAHKDAEIFAEYLVSKDGGGLDSSNVTVLLNEKATSGQFVSALYGLIEESKEGDVAIIYFSGHGDVESTTLNQPGFLLCWDAPARVYMGGGTFGLTYLQEIISTLSLQNKAKVLVFTDACRSGTLAGSKIGGSNATAANLSKQYANEVKIMSCQPNEYALEGKDWGGGRGVFSYYLMDGLKGLADKDSNGEVNLSEIGRYLEDNVPIAVAPHSQMPLILGSRGTVISKVNDMALAELQKKKDELKLNVAGDRGLQLALYQFSDTTKYNTYVSFNNAVNSGHLLYPKEGSAWEIFQEIKSYTELEPYIGLMKRNLSAALQDDAQQAINDYLAADPKELKNRWRFDDKYGRFPESLEKAASLLGPKHFFYKTLKARSYYFEGLNRRLSGEKSFDISLFEQALILQDSCLALMPDAPYALNEKGYTYFLLENYKESLPYFEKTIHYTPTWPLVWSNLCNTYKELTDYDLALKSGLKAIELDSNFALAKYNTALVYNKIGSLSKATEILLEAMKLDSTDHDIYAALGNTEYKKHNLEKARYYYSKSLEFDPLNEANTLNVGWIYLEQKKNELAKSYFLKAQKLYPKSKNTLEALNEFYFTTGDYEMAKDQLENYLKAYPKDYFSFYMLSSVSAALNEKDNALLYLDIAFTKGFKDFDKLKTDSNFKNLVTTKEYIDLISKYSKN